MKKPLTYMQELDFEEWLDKNKCIERICSNSIPHFAKLLISETDVDSYATSPAYYAYTGRRGLWLYHYNKTFFPICWHPNVDGQMLIFPPRGQQDYAAITALLTEAPSPPAGFILARFKSQDVDRLKAMSSFANHESFDVIEEDVLDWRYPVRILSTLKTVQMEGHEYMLIRNRVRQAKKYTVNIERLSSAHSSGIELLALHWANKITDKPEELANLITPYKETLRLYQQKNWGLDGLVFVVDGQIQAATIWDVSNFNCKTANLYMNLCNISYRGLSELAIKATAEELYKIGVLFLNLGGSETQSLDHYKNKFSPEISVSLCSIGLCEAKAWTIDSGSSFVDKRQNMIR